ncbi:MAG: succinate dehydrogenase [Synechococcaceae cyanobacterium]|nr:succinate dehydrogenase [Synechococcaceae cyanobacterium]
MTSALVRLLSAASGLALVLFLLAHLVGISLAPLAPARFETYAAALHQAAWLAPLELALAGVAVTHLALALRRAVIDARARADLAGPIRSRRREPGAALAGFAARLMPWSGALLLVFLVVHLSQLRWPRPAGGQELQRLLAVLQQPPSLLLTSLAGLAVGLHLLQGLESAHRSLGLLDPANGGRIRWLGRSLALLMGGGFALLPFVLRLGAGAATR